MKRKVIYALFAAVLLLSLNIVGAIPSAAADPTTIESSTMVFEGTLTDEGGGIYSGVQIPMVSGGGFDIFADEGSEAWFGNDPGSGPVWTTQSIVNNDAWPTWDPDTPDWYQYSLTLYYDEELGVQKWMLRNHPDGTEDHPWYDTDYWGSELPAAGMPMSGVMDWSRMYAAELDFGHYYGNTGTSEIPNGAANHGGGLWAWDMDWSWGSEMVPLQYVGFSVEIEPIPGENQYRVTLTPDPSPVTEVWVDDNWAGSQHGEEVEEGKFYGYNAFSEIQKAVKAVSHTTIIVMEGTYAGATVNKDVTIVANEGDVVVINDGPNSHSFLRAGFLFTDDYSGSGATIQGFRFEGAVQTGYTDDGALDFGVFSRGADNVTVENNVISNMLQAITNWNGSGWQVTGNEINDLWTLNGGGIGIFVGVHNGDTIDANTIASNNITGTLYVYSGDGGGYDGTGIALYTDFRYGRLGGVITNSQVCGNLVSLISDNPEVVNANGVELTDSRGPLGGDWDLVYTQGEKDIPHDLSINNYNQDGTFDGTGAYATPPPYYTWDVAGTVALTGTIAGGQVDMTITYDQPVGSYYPYHVWLTGTTASDLTTMSGTALDTIGIEYTWLATKVGSSAIDGSEVSRNKIVENSGDGVYVSTSGNNGVNFNCIIDNQGYGVAYDAAGTLDAENNWWGDASGPTIGLGTNNEVSSRVDYDPWIKSLTYTGDPQPSSNVTLEAELINSGDTGIAGVEIEFYINGVLAGTGTTNEDGVATCNVGTQSVGIYNVFARVACMQSEVLLAVYDPSAGFVTGGGWIYSDPGAYVPDPNLEGKATFGFVSRYKKGASVPDGQAEFQFKTGNLNFHSTSYEWLIVTGSDYAKFKGVGTINGEGEYKFQIWAGDDTPDTFRIKIWTEDAEGNETVVYDNGEDQEIGGGSIVIHTAKK